VLVSGGSGQETGGEKKQEDAFSPLNSIAALGQLNAGGEQREPYEAGMGRLTGLVILVVVVVVVLLLLLMLLLLWLLLVAAPWWG
jgi:hypothetical protein